MSQEEVITASRKFVCVRLMTYESASEAQFLKSLWRPGAELENSLFAVLDPYGMPLSRGARSPDWFFRDAHEMAQALNNLANDYREVGARQNLPVVKTVRLGLNVAACDKRPLVVVVADNAEERRALEGRLAQLAWSNNFIGKSIYCAGSRRDLAEIRGANISSGFLFVAPNEFGNEGTVVEQLSASASTSDLQRALQLAIYNYRPQYLDHREHIRMAREQGIRWQSEIPVTDPHELQAQRSPGF